jgi:glyoxylase-like metal-dependent hydrolase (beta-lactamase superfamily II)
LSGGNELLASRVWQPVPGVDGAACYPVIRKIDTISSNSYLIRTPDALILIDPGGLREEADHLAVVIEECRKERFLPLFVFLTHAHVDHFLSVTDTPSFSDPETSVIAVQENGAVALETRDRNVTQAALFGMEIPEIGIGLRLLARECANNPGVPATLTFANGATVSSVRYEISTGSGSHVQREQITFEGGVSLDIYHTPGHSPDSTCLQFGRMLFIGDLLFAANPGIAGLCGWSRDELVESIEAITPLVTGGEIDTVCPGHGRVMSATSAGTMLSSIQNDALSLWGIRELDEERSRETAVYAQECLEHVSELFTIMAGRLYYVSYVIDELGETGMAAHLATLIKSDAVDELLDSFSAFSEEYRSGKQQPIHLALKAAQVILKIERLFDGAALCRIIDPTLVSRAGRLLSDYTTTLRGFSPPAERTLLEIPPILESLITGLSVPAFSDEELLSASDDSDLFVAALLTRIGTPPLLTDVDVTFECPSAGLVAAIDLDRFRDLLTDILEDLVGTGAGKIDISVNTSGPAVVISLAGTGCIESVNERDAGFMHTACHSAGGSLAFDCSGETHRFVVTLGQMP